MGARRDKFLFRETHDPPMKGSPMPAIKDDSLAAMSSPDFEVEHDELPEPENFSFADWLDGIEPIRAKYNLLGLDLALRGRSPRWTEDMTKKTKKLPQDEQDAAFLIGHVESPELSRAQMAQVIKKCHEIGRVGELNELVTLCVHLDTKPRAQISERFLVSASD